MTTSSISRSNRGFTLVELLAVIVISSILIVVAMQGIKVVGSTALQTGVRQFSNDLQMARQYAITKRTRVRVLLAVDTSTPRPSGLDSNTFFRAYCVYAFSNNVDGTVGYARLTDWRVLPNGVVLADQKTHDGLVYSPVALSTVLNPTNGTRQTWNYIPQGTPPASLVNSIFDCATNVVDGATVVTGAGIDFLPSGRANNYYTLAGARAGGVRLAQGSAAYNGSEWNILINNTSNWAYVEYDFLGGRIRTRWVDSYK